MMDNMEDRPLVHPKVDSSFGWGEIYSDRLYRELPIVVAVKPTEDNDYAETSIENVYLDTDSGIMVYDVAKYENWIKTLKRRF